MRASITGRLPGRAARAWLAAGVLAAAGAAQAQLSLPSASTYNSVCASCHGGSLTASRSFVTNTGFLYAADRTAMEAAVAGTSMAPQIAALSTADLQAAQVFLRAVRELVVTSSVSFADTLTNATSTRSVQIANLREEAASFSTSIGGGNAALNEFQVTASTCGSSVPAQSTCTLTVTFDPAAAGARNATLSVTIGGTYPSPATGAGNPRQVPLSGNGVTPVPVFQANPALLPLATVGTTPVSGSSTISNVGTAPMTLSGLALTDTTHFAFGPAHTCSNGLVLATSGVGQSCTLQVVYTPPVDGDARTAQVQITDNASGSPHAVNIDATSAAIANLVLDTSPLEFGEVVIHEQASLPPRVVTSTGNEPLQISSVSVTNAVAHGYSVVEDCTTRSPLSNGQTCSVTVRFQPTTVGVKPQQTLQIASNAVGGTASVFVRGEGVPVPAPIAQFDPVALAFGAQTAGWDYPARSVRLRNTGNAPMLITAVRVEGSGYTLAQASPCGSSLAAGAHCDIPVRFHAAAAGASYTGAVVVENNAAGSPHQAALSGSGVAQSMPSLVWSPAVASLDFGDVAVGSSSAVQTAVLRNQGPGDALLQLVNAIGLASSDYLVTLSGCGLDEVLLEGASCNVRVSFSPNAAGARTAQVQVASNGTAPAALALTGTGLAGPAPGLELSATAFDFGRNEVGSPSTPRELTLRSTGSGTLQITAIAVDGPFEVRPRTCTQWPFSLAPGQECSVSVSFVPTSTATGSGMLLVESNAQPAEVSLSGQPQEASNGSGGGCSMARGTTLRDPTLWLLVAMAGAVLGWRRWQAQRARRA